MKSVAKFIKGFQYAFNGIQKAFTQRNIKIQLLCGIFAVFIAIILNISAIEWACLTIVIFAVIVAELFNTAIEEVCNCLRDHLGASYESTRIARDVAAGAVLLTSICSIIIGLIIFLPKIIN